MRWSSSGRQAPLESCSPGAGRYGLHEIVGDDDDLRPPEDLVCLGV